MYTNIIISALWMYRSWLDKIELLNNKTVLFGIQKLALKTLYKFTDCEILIAMIF